MPNNDTKLDIPTKPVQSTPTNNPTKGVPTNPVPTWETSEYHKNNTSTK